MLRATTSCRLYKAVNKPVKLKTSLAYEEQMKDPIERSLSTGGHTEGLPEAHSVSAVPETLTTRGHKRPPINGGESDLRGICSTGRQQVIQFQSILVKNSPVTG